MFDFLMIFEEHFVVWMRTAGLPNFRKLWGKIETDMLAGSYHITITNSINIVLFIIILIMISNRL